VNTETVLLFNTESLNIKQCEVKTTNYF